MQYYNRKSDGSHAALREDKTIIPAQSASDKIVVRLICKLISTYDFLVHIGNQQ